MNVSKNCRICTKNKPLSEFDFRKDTIKFDTRCKECRGEANNKNGLLKRRSEGIGPRRLKTKDCKKCGNPFLINPLINGIRQKNKHRPFCYICKPYESYESKQSKIKDENSKLIRTCISCKKTKNLDLTNFGNSKRDCLGFRRQCKKCENRNSLQSLKIKKQRWIAYKGGSCLICGYKKCARSMHFHHKNPSEKDFTISSYKYLNDTEILKELDKCVLLCANCHGEVHSGLINLDNLI